MKEFVVYTGLRVVVFLASVAVVGGVWLAVSDDVPVMWVLVVSLLVSGIASYYLLAAQRERFARRVDERARRAAAAFEAQRAREDAD